MAFQRVQLQPHQVQRIPVLGTGFSMEEREEAGGRNPYIRLSVHTFTLLLWIWRAPLAWGGMPCSNWPPGAPCRAERCRPLSRDPHPSGSSILPGGQPRAWSVPRRLPVSAAGPVLAPQRYLYPLLQIGSEQSLICQHRLPTLRCHQPPLLPRSVTCLSEM